MWWDTETFSLTKFMIYSWKYPQGQKIIVSNDIDHCELIEYSDILLYFQDWYAKSHSGRTLSVWGKGMATFAQIKSDRKWLCQNKMWNKMSRQKKKKN